MKYATLTFNKECVYILSIELKDLKLKEGICNARLMETI